MLLFQSVWCRICFVEGWGGIWSVDFYAINRFAICVGSNYFREASFTAMRIEPKIATYVALLLLLHLANRIVYYCVSLPLLCGFGYPECTFLPGITRDPCKTSEKFPWCAPFNKNSKIMPQHNMSDDTMLAELASLKWRADSTDEWPHVNRYLYLYTY